MPARAEAHALDTVRLNAWLGVKLRDILNVDWQQQRGCTNGYSITLSARKHNDCGMMSVDKMIATTSAGVRLTAWLGVKLGTT